MRSVVFGALAVVVLVAASASSAKEFRPGDVRLCDARQCVSLGEQRLLFELSSFVYGDTRVRRVQPLRRGAPVLQLRYRDGYVPGLLGRDGLDRFRSHGVICGRFVRGVWYRVPAPLARDLRMAAVRLNPLRFSGSVPRSC
jgi:hypothetical protein